MPRRYSVLSAVAAGAAMPLSLLVLAPDAAAIMPTRVTFRTDLYVQDGRLRVVGAFTGSGAILRLTSHGLPAPASGGYDVGVSGGDEHLLPASLTPDAHGDFGALDSLGGGDQRLPALDLDTVTLYDGDAIVAVADHLIASAKIFFRSDIRVPDGDRFNSVVVAGRAGRQMTGLASYEVDVITSQIGPGDWTVRLHGPSADFDIPFTIPPGQRRITVVARGGEDEIAVFAQAETAVLLLGGVEVASAPIGAPH